MKREVTIDNRIFKYAIGGVIFFLAAVGFIVLNVTGEAMREASNIVIASLLSVASLSLLYKAIKNDKERLKQA